MDEKKSLQQKRGELKKEKQVDPQLEEAIRAARQKKEAWYALYVQSLHERKIRDAINEQGKNLFNKGVLDYQIQAWVAVRWRRVKYSDRMVNKEVVMAPGVVFVRLRQIDKQQIYIDKHIKSFAFDRTTRMPSMIPEDVMVTFIAEFPTNEDMEILQNEKIEVGKRVKIIAGPMADRVGYLIQRAGSHRFVIKVAEIGFSFEIKEENVEVVDETVQSRSADVRYSGNEDKKKKETSVSMMSMEDFEAKEAKKK